MLITDITLYKVPFDNTYANVFDFKDETERGNFDLFLSQNFSSLSILSAEAHSIKSINHNLVLTITGYYETIINYNYCLLVTNEGKKFYFITDIVSENDSTENPSCTISLEFDSWHNYLTLLQDTSKFDENFVVKCHQNRFIKNDDAGKIFRIYSGTTEDFKNEFSHNKYFTGVNGGTRGGKKQILWLAVMFDDELYYHDHVTPFAIHSMNGMIRNLTNNPVVYIPIRVWDSTIDMYYNDIYIRQYINDNVDPSDFPINLDDNTELFHQLQNTHILDAFLTFHVPFKAYVDEIEGNAKAYIKVMDVESDETEITSGIAISKLYETDSPTEVAIFNFPCICSFRGTLEYIIDSNTFYGYGDYSFDYDSDDYKEIIKTFSSYYKKAESKFYTYPYNYNSVEIRGKNNIVHNINSFRSLGITIDCGEKLIPNMTITHYGYEDRTPCFIKSPSRCTTSKDSFAEFLRNSGQSAYTSLFTGMLTNSINSAVGGLGAGTFATKEGMKFSSKLASAGAISGIGKAGINIAADVMDFTAKLKDVQNQQDIYNIPDFIAQNDMYYQDNMFEYTNEMFIDEEINFVLYNFIRFGYSFNNNKSLRENIRFWFDYTRTNNCYLPFISNMKDRNNIEAIYNNGVTKWHIYNSNNEYIAITDFNYNYNNPEMLLADSLDFFDISYSLLNCVANSDNPTKISIKNINNLLLNFTPSTNYNCPPNIKVVNAEINTWDFVNKQLLLTNCVGDVKIYFSGAINYQYDFKVSYGDRVFEYDAGLTEYEDFYFPNDGATHTIIYNKNYLNDRGYYIEYNRVSGSNWQIRPYSTTLGGGTGWGKIVVQNNTTLEISCVIYIYVHSSTYPTRPKYFHTGMPEEYITELSFEVVNSLTHVTMDSSYDVNCDNTHEKTIKYIADEGYVLPTEIEVTNVKVIEWSPVTGLLVLKDIMYTPTITIQGIVEE